MFMIICLIQMMKILSDIITFSYNSHVQGVGCGYDPATILLV